VIFNTSNGESKESEKIFGLVNSLSIEGCRILYNKFLFTSRNADGTLNGNSDHEYEFEEF
jgi:hypothetical protein